MHIRRRLIAGWFDGLHNAIVLVHDDAVAMAPADHLSALVEAQMYFTLVHARLRRVRDARASGPKACPNEILMLGQQAVLSEHPAPYCLIVKDVDRFLPLLIRRHEIITRRELFWDEVEDSENWCLEIRTLWFKFCQFES